LQYLGDSLEVSGRNILEEDLIQEIVLLSQPGIILMPGQTLPLTIFRPNQISAMKRLIETTKTFGCIHVRFHDDNVGNPGQVTEAPVGTTAEIYEFREAPESGLEVGFKLKVRGRQRFRVLNSRTSLDGLRLANIEILQEKELSDPLFNVRLRVRDKLRPFDNNGGAADGDDDEESDAQSKNSRKRRSSFRENLSEIFAKRSSKRVRSRERKNKEEFLPKVELHRSSKLNHLRTSVYAPPVTRWPNWVYEQYDAKCLVERVHGQLATLRLFSQTQLSIPYDPVSLSFWVAINLPIDDIYRQRILQMDCAVQRLRFELSLLKKVSSIHLSTLI
jgi:cereblon